MSPIPTQPGLIPDDLLSNIKKGDCVLFLGADLPLDYPGAPLSRPQLAAALAERYGLPAGLSWPETVQAYLGKLPGDRHSLVSFVQTHCSGPQVKPGPLHQAIAHAGFRAIVTGWYDELLEEALREAGYRVNRVVRDTQLPYAEEGERAAIVVKLYGCLSDPDSLVLDRWQHEQLMDQLSRKLEVVTAFCTLRPPLFVNFDLLQSTPIRLYVRASAGLTEHMRRAYAVWPGELDTVQATWQGQNVEFRQGDAAAFMQALSGQVTVPGVGPGRRIHVQRPPYKFLDYYEAKDADIFCGRDTESQIVTRRAVQHRVLTLFGPSGAGKTSLLLAGVLPRLADEGYGHVYVRALDDPLPALCRAVAARAGRAFEPAGEIDLRAFLEQTLAPGDKLVVVLDQFEEVFLRVGSSQRAVFFRELARALSQPPREVRVIFSLREDYLAHLDEARDDLPDLQGDRRRLIALDRGNARVAITEPAARAGVMVEPTLVDVLVGGEESRGTGDLMEVSTGQVPPAILQIVMDYLYHAALPAGHPEGAAPPVSLLLTLDSYRAVRYRSSQEENAQELAGAEAILAGYVHQGLASLPDLRRSDGSPLGADPAIGRAILKVMVTSQRTKAVLTQAEMVELLDEVGAIRRSDRRDHELVEATRLGLEQVRLVRSFKRDGAALYELAHDTMAAEIATWISQEELAGKMAREFLRRGLDDWRSAQKLLLRPETLALVHERRDDLKRLSKAELELLFRSALAHGFEVPYWFKRAQAASIPVDAIALEGLSSDSFRTRSAAVLALAQFGELSADYSIAMLADDYPQVRVAAIAALERLRPDGAWRSHLKYECYVPAGEFVMGDDSGDRDDQKPAHKVYLEAFYVGKYPVTNAEYARFMADRGRGFDMPAGKEDYPVVNVSWYDAKDYADWAGMRLPTEAQWEKAAAWDAPAVDKGTRRLETIPEGQGLMQRIFAQQATVGGKKRKYPWGDTFDKNKCNTRKSNIGDTTPVGKYSPAGDSPYGVADMAGNVWEWCSSLYRDYPYKAEDGRENLTINDTRVLRGGSWYDNQDYAAVPFRIRYYPDLRYDYYGIRVCAVIQQE